MFKKFLCKNERIDSWLKMHLDAFLKKGGKITDSEIDHIIDYLKSTQSPKRISRLGVIDAKKQSENWTLSLNKKNKKDFNFLEKENKDVSVFKKYENGFYWVKLVSESSYKKEGFMMNHCVSSYFSKKHSTIYSLRDSENNPHCTIEYSLVTNSINQIKGKHNHEISKKYVDYVIDFLNDFNLDEVELKPYDLIKLGAYLVLRESKKMVSKINSLKENDEFLNEFPLSDLNDLILLPKRLNFNKLIIKDSNVSVDFLKDWKFKSLVLVNSNLEFKELKVFHFEAFKSKVKLDKLISDSFVFDHSDIIVNEVFSESGKIINDSEVNLKNGKISDLVLTKSSIINTDSRLICDFVSISDFLKKKIFYDIFKNMKISTYLELSGIFCENLLFPKMSIKTLKVSDSNIKKIPETVVSDKIFYDDEVLLIEGTINRKIKA